MIHELERVVLADDLPNYKLKRGDIGTVVLVHRAGSGYEVKFIALELWETLAVVTLYSEQVRPIGHHRG